MAAVLWLVSALMAFADTGAVVAVSSVATTCSTDLQHPGMYVIDGDGSTSWELAPGATDGRLELSLSQTTLVSGIMVSGTVPAGTRLEFQFLQNGRWVSFASASLSNTNLDAQFVDLSFDRAVTNQIALVLSGSDAASSSIGELSVSGVPAGSVMHRIQPVDLTASSNTSYFTPAENLVDGDTWTTWTASLSGSFPRYKDDVEEILKSLSKGHRGHDHNPVEASVDFDLGAEYEIDAVHVYLPQSTRERISVSVEKDGSWRQVGSVAARSSSGWQVIDLSGVSGNAARITVSGSFTSFDSIGEVEFWGKGSGYQGSLYDDAGISTMLSNTTAVNYNFVPSDVTRSAGATLEITVRDAISQPLQAELNGISYQLTNRLSQAGVTIYQLSLPGEAFWSGENYLRITPLAQDAMIISARLLQKDAPGDQAVLGDGLCDGFLYTPNHLPATKVYTFGRSVLVRSLEVYGAVLGTYTVEAKDSTGAWVTLVLSDTQSTKSLYDVGFVTSELRLQTTGSNIAEIRVLGSPTTDQTPVVRFIWPTDEQDTSDQQAHWRSEGLVVGFVDNPRAHVKVNGVSADQLGHYFWISIDELEDRNVDPVVLTAVATDSKGRTGQASMLYSTTDSKLVTLDQADQILYSQTSAFTVSGSLRRGNHTVLVDGTAVTVTNRRFSTTVSLVEGLNIIRVTVADRRSTDALETLIRKVVYNNSSALAVRLSSPANGAYLGTKSVTFSGTVTGTGIASVTVNGVSATLSGFRFSTGPITLREGENTITVVATDHFARRVTLTASIHVDITKPTIAITRPASGSILNSSIVDVAGTVTDASPVWVLVNGKAAGQTSGAYTVQLGFDQGLGTVNVQAQDAAGNWSDKKTVSFTVDTTPPDSLSVAATPSGWTSNRQPTITFSGRDAISGIDHYELSIGTGSYTTVVSPYPLLAQPDGVQTVSVKAVDRAGWTRLATVQVFIDTTPPPAPQYFRTVPGNALMSLKWVKPSDDTVLYSITRAPTWSDGNHAATGEGLDDSDVANGSIYSYTITAVDHAQNESPTATASGMVGVAVAAYTPGTGAVLEYQNLAAFIPKESLPDTVVKVQVTEVQSPAMVEQSYYPIVSPIYDFSAVVIQDGQETTKESIGFDKPFKAVLHYDPSQLPPDFPEQNLGVYYFDPMWSRWFKVEDSAVSVADHIIVFSTTHFTSFSVQPTVMEDLSPQELKDVGHSPFKSEVSHGGVTVSPQAGSAMTEVTELVLPGKAGFNFVLKRTYDSATARGDATGLNVNVSIGMSSITKILSGDVNPLSLLAGPATGVGSQIESAIKKVYQNSGDYAYSMGLGWRLNFPYIRGSNSSVLVRLPSGSFYSVNGMKITDLQTTGLTRQVTFENHESEDFTLSVYQFRSDIEVVSLIGGMPKVPGWMVGSATLTLKDGTTYQFDSQGRILWMKDPTGLNTITFKYDSSDPLSIVLSNVADSMGRQIDFQYDMGFLVPRIKKISVEDDPFNRSIEYTLQPATGVFPFSFPLLYQAKDVGGRVWSYQYDHSFLFGGNLGFSVNFLVLLGDMLTGGWVGSILGKDSITLNGGFQVEWVFPLRSVEGPGSGSVTIDNTVLNLDYSKFEWIDYIWLPFVDWIPTGMSISWNFTNRIVTTAVTVSDFKGLSPTLTTSYSYNFSYYGYDQFYSKTSTINDGKKRVTTNYSAYDKTVSRWIDNTDSWVDVINGRGFTPDPVFHNITPYETSQSTIDAQSGAFVESSTSAWDLNTMRITNKSTQRSSTVTRAIDYVYDGWGNMTYTSDRQNVGDRIEQTRTWSYFLGTGSSPASGLPWQPDPYSPPSVSRNIKSLPLGQIMESSLPSQANQGSASYRQTFYNYASLGQKSAESSWVDGGWAETRYSYDATSGDLTQVTKPDGHTTDIVHDYTHSDYYYVTTTERSVRAADGSTRDLVSVVANQRATGFKAWEKNARGYVTEYSYDALGRVTKRIKPDDTDTAGWDPRSGSAAFRADNPATTIAYDDGAFTATVVGNRGQTTAYTYDSLGKLAKIDKYNRPRDASGNLTTGASQHIITTVIYSPWGEMTAITDPRGFTTTYTYDVMGRTSSVTYPLENGAQPQKTMRFDYSTGIQTVIDERANVTLETYDLNDKLLHRQQPLGVETSSWYDGFGQVVASTDGEGRLTTMAYNELGLPVLVILPSEEYYEGARMVSYSPQLITKYDKAGHKIEERTHASDRDYITSYTDDGLGHPITTMRPYTDHRSGSPVSALATELTFYDENGNKIRAVDANNSNKSGADQLAKSCTYSARDKLAREVDEEGNATETTYDADDNKVSMTDPRGTSGLYSGDFTINYVYDDLNRLVFAQLPQGPGQTSKPTVSLLYDPRGNLFKRTDADGGATLYEYSPRNKPTKETRQGVTSANTQVSVVTSRQYDPANNESTITDGAGNTTHNFYDSLNRLTLVRYPEGNQELFAYDKVGNKTQETNGNGHITMYIFDSQKRAISTTDALGHSTTTRFDAHGGKTYNLDANANAMVWLYDERGLMVKETDALGNITTNVYDPAGYLVQSIDPNGTSRQITYAPNYKPRVVVLSNGSQSETTTYSYDEAGDTKQINQNGISATYNTLGGLYTPDPYSLVHTLDRTIDSESFSLGYAYDQLNRITRITTPDGRSFSYLYDTLGRVEKVLGYIDSFIQYDANGKLSGYHANNGMDLTVGHDVNQRLTELDYHGASDSLTRFSLTYDRADNVISRNYSYFAYDELERLSHANQYGKFAVDPVKVPSTLGTAPADYAGEAELDFAIQDVSLKLDYNAISIGVDLGDTQQVTRLVITPQMAGHRLQPKTVAIYTALTNSEGAYQRQGDWTWKLQQDGSIRILFRNPVEARFVKLHSYFDDRDANNLPVDTATVQNGRTRLLTVYYDAYWRMEGYQYDAKGNRIRLDLQLGSTSSITNSTYYPKSDRLKTDGIYGYNYDNSGNLIEKGSVYTDNGASLAFMENGGDYWRYNYDLENRLVAVSHGTVGTQSVALVVSYTYDPTGVKLKTTSVAKGITYTVYGTDGNVLSEQSLATGATSDYLYLFGRHFARVTTTGAVSLTSYYLTDNLGSTVMQTDQSGKVQWSTDYSAFGESGAEAGSAEESGKFTGKDYDSETRLYYSNARWYDPTTGRFITEDPARDGDNWFAYCSNNPLRYVDPTGLLDVVQQYLTSGNARPGTKLIDTKAIVLHWTGSVGQTAEETWQYFNSGVFASSQYIIGQKGEVLHAVPDTEVAYHSGGWEREEQRGNKGGLIFTQFAKGVFKTDNPNFPTRPNEMTLGIEVNPKNEQGEYTPEAYKSMVELTASLVKETGLDKGNPIAGVKEILFGNALLRHEDITGKECPKLFADDKKWGEFRANVALDYAKNWIEGLLSPGGK